MKRFQVWRQGGERPGWCWVALPRPDGSSGPFGIRHRNAAQPVTGAGFVCRRQSPRDYVVHPINCQATVLALQEQESISAISHSVLPAPIWEPQYPLGAQLDAGRS